MSGDSVRIDMEVPENDFQELKAFIDENKSSRRSSKRFYGGRIFDMALDWKREREENMQLEAAEFREVAERIKQVLEE